mgnify:FL=1
MSKVHGKIRSVIEDSLTDFESGEVKVARKTITKNVPYDKFIKIYLEDFSGFLNIGKGEIRVLSYCWQISEYNTGRIYLVKKVKEEMSAEVKIKIESIDNIIYKLVRKNLLISEGTSVYRLNPKFFWKGDEAERCNVLQVVINYNLSCTPGTEERVNVENESFTIPTGNNQN